MEWGHERMCISWPMPYLDLKANGDIAFLLTVKISRDSIRALCALSVAHFHTAHDVYFVLFFSNV